MDPADEIWNRALEPEDAPATEGDRALRDALLLHGMALNGGLLHAVEGLEPVQVDDAVAGLRWLGLGELASEIASFAADAAGTESLSPGEVEELEERGNDLYYGTAPDDDVIDAAFRQRLAQHPEAFAPVR